MALKQIAQELGLSLTTVSRALNGYPEVAEATRTAVQAAATRLQHRPNARARALATGRVDAVGMIFPVAPGGLGDLSFLEVAQALGERLRRDGIDLLIIPTAADDELSAYRRAVGGARADAFVVPRTWVHDERLDLLQRSGVPFVAYGRSAGFEAPYAWFDVDHVAGARLAADRLIGLGHRRLGYLGASPDYNFAAQRYAGFAEALDAAGMALDPQAVARDALDRRSGYAAMQKLLGLADPPTAVVVDNHLAGVGAVHAALQARRALGRDLSLIVHDGATLAELTLARLQGEAPESLQRLRVPELVVGDSDGPPFVGQ